MRSAFFISSRKETDGGGYTLLKELFDEIIKKKKNLFFILWSKDNDYFKKILLNKKIDFIEVNENKLTVFILSLIPFLGFIFSFNLRKTLKKKNINKIVYLSSEYYYPIFTNYIATVWDIQHITNPHFVETGSLKIRIFRNIVVNQFIKKANKIILGTIVGKNEIIKNFKLNENKFILIPHPTPRDCFTKKKKFNSKNFFIYPANYWEHKNHFYLLKTFKELILKFNYKKKLILVGAIKNQEYFLSIKKFIQDNKLEKKIQLKTFITRSKLIKYYDNCEALIYPSTSGPENLPPLEAMARGKNVIISNYPGSREQFKEWATYFDFNKKNSLRNILLKKKYVKSSFKLISYSKTKTVKNYLNVLFKNI